MHRGIPDQSVQIISSNPPVKRLDSKEFPRIPVQHCCNFKPLPKHPDLSDIGMPDEVGGFRIQEMGGIPCLRYRNMP